jgi:hypothetical protein
MDTLFAASNMSPGHIVFIDGRSGLKAAPPTRTNPAALAARYESALRFHQRGPSGRNPAFVMVLAASGDDRKRNRATAASTCWEFFGSAPSKSVGG